MKTGLVNQTTAAGAFLALFPSCYVGPDSVVVDTETTAAAPFDTGEEEAGSTEDEASTSSPGDDTNGDSRDDTDGTAPPSADPQPTLVEFRIQPGTGNEAWNTEETMLVTDVGQTLLLINDDSIRHTLHSFGVPMAHGDPIEPGESAQYVLAAPYDRGDQTPELWDHEAGEPAYFWLQVLPRDDE